MSSSDAMREGIVGIAIRNSGRIYVAGKVETRGEYGITASVKRVQILRAAIFDAIATINQAPSRGRKAAIEKAVSNLQKELDVIEPWNEYVSPLAWWFET